MATPVDEMVTPTVAHAPAPWSAEFDQQRPWTVRIRDAGGNVVFEQYGACSSTKQRTYQDFLRAVGFKRGDKQFTSREEAQRLVQQQIANVLLAAAAPDMYALLRAINEECDFATARGLLLPAAFIAAVCRSTIAKAEGRQP